MSVDRRKLPAPASIHHAFPKVALVAARTPMTEHAPAMFGSPQSAMSPPPNALQVPLYGSAILARMRARPCSLTVLAVSGTTFLSIGRKWEPSLIGDYNLPGVSIKLSIVLPLGHGVVFQLLPGWGWIRPLIEIPYEIIILDC